MAVGRAGTDRYSCRDNLIHANTHERARSPKRAHPEGRASMKAVKIQKSQRKLTLNKATLRLLGEVELINIAGGIITFECGATQGQRCLNTAQDPCNNG